MITDSLYILQEDGRVHEKVTINLIDILEEVRTSLSLSASLICLAMNRTALRACRTSGVKLRGIMLSESANIQ